MITIPASRRFGPGTDNAREYEATYTEGGKTYRIVATVSHDDQCRNGHNTFSMTASIWEKRTRCGSWLQTAGGCHHDEIVKHFPELAPYVKWHLCSTDGPMHYLANTMSHARDLDCWGKRKGEPKSWEWFVQVNGDPILHRISQKFTKWLIAEVRGGARKRDFSIVEVPHKPDPTGYKFEPNYTFEGYRKDKIEWYQCPFDRRIEAEQWVEALKHHRIEFVEVPTSFGEGSEPDLKAARRSAIWPDGTLEDLQSEEALKARLPGLLEDFKAAVESLGLVY